MDNEIVSQLTNSIINHIFETCAIQEECMDELIADCADFTSGEISNAINDIENKHSEDLLRAAASMENLKKRKEREYKELKKLANKDLLLSILPILDTLEMSIEFGENQSTDVVISHFKSILKSIGVEEIDTSGKFDPEVHNAIAVRVMNDGDGTIWSKSLTGYMLNGKLLRPANVIVAKKEK